MKYRALRQPLRARERVGGIVVGKVVSSSCCLKDFFFCKCFLNGKLWVVGGCFFVRISVFPLKCGLWWFNGTYLEDFKWYPELTACFAGFRAGQNCDVWSFCCSVFFCVFAFVGR